MQRFLRQFTSCFLKLIMIESPSLMRFATFGLLVFGSYSAVSAQDNPINLALNPSRTGFPHPLDSDPGWGGGADVWDIVDGVSQYQDWTEGLAFTGGRGPYGGQPAGIRQATIDFGEFRTFEEVIIWHHGDDDVPATAQIDYWDGGQWIPVSFSRFFDATYPTSSAGWSRPDKYTFSAVTGSKVRYSFDNSGNAYNGNPMRHGWIYQFDVFDIASVPPEPTNLAFNPTRSGFPHPLDSDPGWGGGADVWDIVDGVSQYQDWTEGLAFTWGGLRQATIDFGEFVTFEEVVIWHHGGNDVPATAELDYWDGSQWLSIDFCRFFDATYPTSSAGWSHPDRYTFSAVTGSKVRYSFDNTGNAYNANPMRHGWIYQFDVFDIANPKFVGPVSGMLVEGIGQVNDFNATHCADNTYWAAHGAAFAFEITDPVSQFELTATAPTAYAGGSIQLHIEASKQNENGNLNVGAQLFNFDSGQYVALPGIMPLTTIDTIQSFDLPGGSDPADFIDPGTNEVRLLIQTIQTSGSANVRTQLDLVRFIFD